MKINLARMQDRFNSLASFGATEQGGLSRLALSDADKQARDQLVVWLKEAGLSVRIDDVGNIYGRREGTNPEAAPVLIGSHLDTVFQGGRFDGITGVLGAFEIMETLNDNQVKTHSPLEVVVFTNEEGARFQPPLLGSGAVAGAFTREFVYSRQDRNEKTFEQELKRIGYQGKEENRPHNVSSYLELHIEQGPVLESRGISVGVVDGIQGMVWLEVTVHGQADHAGPSPMDMRHDSLVASARIIEKVCDLAYELGQGSVTTVGRIKVEPDIINVIPGKTVFTVDIRNAQDEIVDQGIVLFKNMVEQICKQEQVGFEIKQIWKVPATPFDPKVIKAVEESVQELGYSYMHITSGAGHDAQYMAKFAPTGMIFVPTVNGKSHCQEESANWEDIERAVNVALGTVLNLAE